VIRLIATTKTDETEVYITKLALSVGRSKSFHVHCRASTLNGLIFVVIIRPKVESELSIQDRHPTRKSPLLSGTILF
jgi:hypothetical protein